MVLHTGSTSGKQGPQIRQVQREAEAAGIPCRSLSKHDLNVLTDNAAHQVSSFANSFRSWLGLCQLVYHATASSPLELIRLSKGHVGQQTKLLGLFK